VSSRSDKNKNLLHFPSLTPCSLLVLHLFFLFFLCTFSTLSCINLKVCISNHSHWNPFFFMLIPQPSYLLKYLSLLLASTCNLHCPTIRLLIHGCILHMTKTCHTISIIIALISSMFLT
jgi:hypothetical protein